jgi:hypothetical protein
MANPIELQNFLICLYLSIRRILQVIMNDFKVTQEALDLNYDGMIIETHIDQITHG